MSRINPLIYIMAIALGALVAFGIPKAAAEECASFDTFLAQAEKISAKGGDKPFWFHPNQAPNKNDKDQIDYTLHVYFAGDPGGFFFWWNSKVCKANYVQLPANGFLELMGEKERQRLMKWKPKPVGLRGA